MAKNKYKPLTARQKKWRKEFREEMREQGLIPPVKTRLNRKAFLQATFSEYVEIKGLGDMAYVQQAIAWMVSKDTKRNITSEQVGVLKMMKIAVAIKRFEAKKSKEGEIEYSITELYEQAIKPILDL